MDVFQAPHPFATAMPLIVADRRVGGAIPALPADDTLQTVVQLSGDDELAGVVTVAYALDEITFASGDVLRVRSRVSWGSGGRQHYADIDVRRGTMVSVPASFLRVDVANEGTQVTPTVGVQVGYLPRGGGGSPTRTLYRDTTLSNGSTADFTVPNFARYVSVVRTPQTAAMTLRFLDSNSVLCCEVRVAASADVFRIPVANDIETVRVLADGTDIPRLRLVFDLDL